MDRNTREFNVVILEDEDNGYIAIVPELPGCHTQGDSLDEVIKNIREAIELYLETLSEEERRAVKSKSYRFSESESNCLK